MSWEDIKSAVLALFERISQANWYQPEQALKPIPIEQQRPHHPQQRQR